MRRRSLGIFSAICLAALVAASPAVAAFGLERFEVSYTDAAGMPVTQAGAHPFAMTTFLRFHANESPGGGLTLEEAAKDIELTQTEGFVGDPTAIPRCKAVDFLTRTTIPSASGGETNVSSCPDHAAVGTVTTVLANQEGGSGEISAAVYDVEPPPGKPAKLGFWIAGVPVTVELGISEEFPYEINGGPTNISQVVEIGAAEFVLWGNPADSRHDALRGKCIDVTGLSQGTCPFEPPASSTSFVQKPFLTLPRACSTPPTTLATSDSWEHPGLFTQPVESVQPSMTGCTTLGFNPQVDNQPTEHAAESSTGLDFELNMDDPGLTEPEGIAGSDIEKAVVTLPKGISTNPAVANGLQACSLAQYQASKRGARQCPEASKVGEVEVETPLLEEEGGGPEVLHGQIYVAKQHDNPFDNLLTIYMMIEDPKLGIFIKVPGKVEPDPAGGQLTTTFDHLPPLPFSHFHLHFREGRRAPLMTPPTCGSFSSEAELYPYANPGVPVQRTATFTIGSGTGGSPCASSSDKLPNAPTFAAGTVDPTAGAYSPFVLRLARSDGSQQFSSIATTLPQGLIGKLTGIPYCPEAAIGQASSRSGEGQGEIEVSHPSCPQASEVGTVTVAAGAGPEPLYVSGHAYLAGPYKGAPLSLEIVTPAIAGPFDLGVVAVRTALQVDPLTTQITAVSDPIPTILHGLPLDVRSFAVDLSRPGFTLNPTSCAPKSIVGSETSTIGNVASLGEYFQASMCAKLAFKPTLKLDLKGPTRRSGHPALRAVLTYPKHGAYANIARAQVGLPHSEFLDQSNLDRVCTQPDLKAGSCPASSIYGKAKAWTPLLEKPLQGPVYLAVGFGFKLPALVAELNGQIRVLLKGKVDTTKHKGIRNTFEAVPDAPVSRFELRLKGGKKYGLLENSENICRKPQQASARFVAQNGRATELHPAIKNDCAQVGKGKRHGPRRHPKK
jgi:hypothetical protein